MFFVEQPSHMECVVLMSRKSEKIGVCGLTVRFVRVGHNVPSDMFPGTIENRLKIGRNVHTSSV